MCKDPTSDIGTLKQYTTKEKAINRYVTVTVVENAHLFVNLSKERGSTMCGNSNHNKPAKKLGIT
jgi:hypothetical protein